jgi:N-acetylneuraminic acid mutarotase
MRWRQLQMPGGLPHPRTDHSLVTDGQRLFLFGGRSSGSPLGDLWTYDLNTNAWTQSDAPGPADRFGHNAAYDAMGGRMLVFGGQAGGFFNDAWTFDGSAWTELANDPRPAQRYGAASALDAQGRLLISHGFTNQGRFDDTWSLDQLPLWADVSPTANRPIKRCLCRGAWDSSRDRFLMFGGQTNGEPFLGDTWTLDAKGWQEITSEPRPSPRNFYAMAETDPGRIALFGGNTADGATNDVWLFDAQTDTWLAQAEGESPSPRYGHDAVWVSDGRRFIVFGGHDATGDLNDLWELTIPV